MQCQCLIISLPISMSRPLSISRPVNNYCSLEWWEFFQKGIKTGIRLLEKKDSTKFLMLLSHNFNVKYLSKDNVSLIQNIWQCLLFRLQQIGGIILHSNK